jgi:carbamoyl-phosphate synthase small subunit
MTTSPWTEKKPTAVLVFADGTVVRGHGVGATGEARAEVCFNTALTGYQEILTDPSYLGQIVTFTFPTSATSAPMRRTSRTSPPQPISARSA